MFHSTRMENTFQDVVATFLPSPLSLSPSLLAIVESWQRRRGRRESKLNSSVSFDDKPARTAHRVKRTPTTASGPIRTIRDSPLQCDSSPTNRAPSPIQLPQLRKIFTLLSNCFPDLFRYRDIFFVIHDTTDEDIARYIILSEAIVSPPSSPRSVDQKWEEKVGESKSSSRSPREEERKRSGVT